MADVIRERQYVVDGRRADDIEVHERRWWQSNGLLLALLGLLALAVIAIFLYDRGRSARAPVIEPTTPRVEAPANDVRAPVLAPPPSPGGDREPAMAPPPPPEEQNVTPPVVPTPTERDTTKDDEKNTNDMTSQRRADEEKGAAEAQGQAADADKQKADMQGQQTDADEQRADMQGQQTDMNKGQQMTAQGQQADADKQKADMQGQQTDTNKGRQMTAQGQQTDADKQKADMQGQQTDTNKGRQMTADKQTTPVPAKPQQPGQTGTPTAPKAAAASAPAAETPWATAASGKGCQRLDIYFNPQSMKLTAAENQKLDRLAECLKNHPGTVVKFEGRSDGVELSNGDLLAKDRARLIADQLEERGIKECRFIVVNARPTCTQNDFACRRQNRSVSVISDF